MYVDLNKKAYFKGTGNINSNVKMFRDNCI